MIFVTLFDSAKGRAEARQKAQSIVEQVLGADAMIERMPNGAPYVVGRSEVNISISHTSSVVALMVARQRCGMDIEHVGRDVQHLARRFAHPSEIELCRSVFAQNAALLVWCAKEVLYKLCQRPGSDFLRDFRITAVEGHQLQALAFGDTYCLAWQVVELGQGVENIIEVYTL